MRFGRRRWLVGLAILAATAGTIASAPRERVPPRVLWTRWGESQPRLYEIPDGTEASDVSVDSVPSILPPGSYIHVHRPPTVLDRALQYLGVDNPSTRVVPDLLYGLSLEAGPDWPRGWAKWEFCGVCRPSRPHR